MIKRFFSATHEEILKGETTDLYFLRAMEILKKIGKAHTSVFAEIFPQNDGIFCGLEEVKLLLENRGVSLWSLQEGMAFSKHEVVMQIEGPYEAFGIYETAILGILSSSSGWCTHAKLCHRAARGKPVISFGSRHIHPSCAPVMERSALVGGVESTSNILAAKLLGKTPSGTMPHAFVLIVGDTVEAAKAYDLHVEPSAPRVVLVDTFRDEAEESLRVAEALGRTLHGVRLDTPAERGRVTPELVKEVRARLNLAGFSHVKIFVSGGLNPERISLLEEAGADAFGVGSFISTAPPIEMTMDIKEIEGKPMAKRGRIPGRTKNPRLSRIF
jgi:nicotinate phosphoribosyltransferase